MAAALLLPLLTMAEQAEPFKFIVWHGNEEEKVVAVTIDDCYRIDHVERILDLAEACDVPFTFFLVGNAVTPDRGDTYRRAIELGCELGNHTFNHAPLAGMDERVIISQLNKTQLALDEALGAHYPMQVMRPPYGSYTKDNVTISKPVMNAGYRHIVLWNVSQTDPAKAYHAVRNGCIMLYHALIPDAACLEELVPRLLQEGYRFVTVSELLGLPLPQLEPLQ